TYSFGGCHSIQLSYGRRSVPIIVGERKITTGTAVHSSRNRARAPARDRSGAILFRARVRLGRGRHLSFAFSPAPIENVRRCSDAAQSPLIPKHESIHASTERGGCSAGRISL